MASLARLGRSIGRNPVFLSSLLLHRTPVLTAITRNETGWNKDWQPGPYPKTERERLAAAKKYGLRPEDYQPYPDDGFGHGDYPMLSPVGEASRDPYENYDFPDMKRNYGDMVHHDHDAIKEAYFDPTQQYRHSWAYMHMWLFLLAAGIGIVYYYTQPYPHHHPVLPKDIVGDGRKHYTFEPLD